MRFVDLSAPIEQSPPETPEPLRTEIEFLDHAGGAAQIERMVNLDAVPPTGFELACFPLRISGASAAPARVLAVLPE